MLRGVHEGVLNAVGFGGDLQERGMLRLTARATMVEDQALRDTARQLRAMVLLDHGQRQIENGRGASRRPDRAVDDVDAVFLDLDRGKTRLKLPGSVVHGW